jgi:hypothetical protein
MYLQDDEVKAILAAGFDVLINLTQSVEFAKHCGWMCST